MICCKYGMVLIFLWTNLLFAQPAQPTRHYEVPQAKILYEVTGGGALTNDLNLTLEGKGEYLIDQWGAKRLWRGEVVEMAVGSFEDMRVIHKEVLIDEQWAYDVDLKQKKITKLPAQDYHCMQYDLATMHKKGSDTIASIPCEVWESDQMKLCLYKGIPLRYEKYAMGLHLTKKARSVILEETIPKEAFALPDLPVEKKRQLGLGLKVTKMHLSTSMVRELCESGTAPKTPQEIKEIKQKYLEALFMHQKEIIPQRLKAMEEARLCLSTTKSKAKTDQCVDTLRKAIGSTTEYQMKAWEESNTTKILDHLDSTILRLKQKLPCVKRAKTLDYLSSCMQ